MVLRFSGEKKKTAAPYTCAIEHSSYTRLAPTSLSVCSVVEGGDKPLNVLPSELPASYLFVQSGRFTAAAAACAVGSTSCATLLLGVQS